MRLIVSGGDSPWGRPWGLILDIPVTMFHRLPATPASMAFKVLWVGGGVDALMAGGGAMFTVSRITRART